MTITRKILLGIFGLALSCAFPLVTDATADTLNDVRSRGYLIAGVNGNLAGFGRSDQNGVWRGLDVDTARAVAAAVFGDADKVKFMPLSVRTRFTALQSGEIDVLTRNCTRTLIRDTRLGLNFAQPNFFDGQGFLVPRKLGIRSARELDGATVCVLPGTNTELNVTKYFRTNGMRMNSVAIENVAELGKAFFDGRCDCLTNNISVLASYRSRASRAQDYMLLPELITIEPYAPVVRHGDSRWKDVVRYSIAAMIDGEELGLTSRNVAGRLKTRDYRLRRFLGTTRGNGKALGLEEKWAFNIISQVGNYGEVFARNVGEGSKLGLPRGPNALWTQGGLMYAPPLK